MTTAQHLHPYKFQAGGKALTATTAANGDLIIEGYAAVWDGLDRQGENFAPGAFTRGIKSFLGGQSALAFHHKTDQIVGKVLDLEERPAGLWMRARVDHQEPSSPLRHIYNAVKKGTINGLSVGGYFRRALVNGRLMIADMDFTEVSVTGVPIHAGTSFAVVAGKALTDATDDQASALDRADMALTRAELAMVRYKLHALRQPL